MLTIMLAAAALPLLAMTACPVDPAIANVVAKPLSDNGNLTDYDVAITLKNVGSRNQPATVLQSVNIYQDATKVDQKGAQPLRAGASETLHFRFERSSEARTGSTHMRFRLVVRDPHVAVQDCSTANDSFRLDV
jgi:hypothetical protein